MKNSIRFSLLKIIASNGNVTSVLRPGFDYDQIIEFLNELINEGFISRVGNKLTLTTLGNFEISRLTRTLGKNHGNIWIEPQIGSQIPKISINDIFLPNQFDLFFD